MGETWEQIVARENRKILRSVGKIEKAAGAGKKLISKKVKRGKKGRK